MMRCPVQSIIKYSVVLLCIFIFFVRNIHNLRLPCVHLLLLAFVLSAAADYCLVFTFQYATGLILFCLAQCCYCKILRYPLLSLLENGMLGCVLLWMSSFFLSITADLTLMLAFFYLFCLLTNVTLAWKKSSWSFAVAITLLLLCDIHVGLYNVPFYFSVSDGTVLSWWCTAANHIIWIFYLPAQFLFALHFPGKEGSFSLPGNELTRLKA